MAPKGDRPKDTKSVATPAGTRTVSSKSSAAKVSASTAAKAVSNSPRSMSPARAAVQPAGAGGSKPVAKPAAKPAASKKDGYTSLRDMFDGGGPGKSGKTFEGGRYSGLANALGISPLGAARDRVASAPAFVGSSDRGDRDRRGIASVAPTTPTPTPTPTPAPETPPTNLATIGAPTTPMQPVFEPPTTYTFYDQFDQLGPQGGYGTAFGPMINPYQNQMFDAMFNAYQNAPQSVGGIDIFSPYGMR